MRQLTGGDRLLDALQAGLQTLARRPHGAGPAERAAAREQLDAAERELAGRLMRVNHVGEVCAQALYRGQALMADDETLRAHLLDAAAEEADHLEWCERRLDALGARTSLLNPLWYAGAFALGVAAGRAGRGVSLGFVAETESQVEAHLDSHLDRLPAADTLSRRVVAQMKADEVRHGQAARERGGVDLPWPARWAMRAAGKVMTTIAHRV